MKMQVRRKAKASERVPTAAHRGPAEQLNLASQEVLKLQRVVGNQVVARLIVQRDPPADAGTKAPADAGTAEKHYSLKEGEDIKLSADVEGKITLLADAYYKKRKKDIVITSGTRTVAEQASAMYGKLEEGDDLSVYGNQTAAKAVKDAYNSAKNAKKSAADIKSAMSAVIQKQVDEGTYISNHLRAGAFDVRNRDMSDEDKKAFKEAASGVDGLAAPIEEGKPPHFHLQLN
jgi:hypothetical protein